VHVLNVQGSQWGQNCYINLGIHILGLPTGGGPPTPTPSEYQCAIRTRLEPPPDVGEGGWPYGKTIAEAEEVARTLAAVFVDQGEQYFSGYSKWPEDFAAVVRRALSNESTGPGIDTIRLAAHLGMHSEALALAERALLRAPTSATRFRAQLEPFLGR
jgi:hypothetical protein